MLRVVRRIGKAASFYLHRPLAVLDRDRVVTTADGFRMLCLRENLIERTIMDTGVWEPHETAAVKRLVKPGSVCVDVGANVGYFSLLMASLGGSVHAFEPTSYGFSRLGRNLALNRELATRINAVKMGLSERKETLTVALEARFSLRVLAHNDAETISLNTLDSFWAGPIHFLKVDVDGHDAKVIRGACMTLTKHRPVVLAEFSPKHLALYGESLMGLAASLCACGYDDCVILETGERTTLRKYVLETRALDTSRNLLLT